MTEKIDIILPEGQQEGTVSTIGTWMKKPGDKVTADEPVVELETDKVNTEVAAPISGVLEAILKEEGEEVAPGDILGRILVGDSQTAQIKPEPSQNPEPTIVQTQTPQRTSDGDCSHLLSPSVRRLFSQHGLDRSQIKGTGKGGRITYQDVQQYLAKPRPVPKPAPKAVPTTGAIPGRMVPHDTMRRRIADHMVQSLLHVAPHVTSIFEMDMSAIMADRKKQKPAFAAKGVNLTYTAYFVAASVAACEAVPEVNSRFHEQGLEIFEDINIGVGTALEDKGLVVPVIHRAQQLNLFGIAQNLGELTERARTGSLVPANVQNGTFTISNHGVSGSLIAAPIIINQPQSAILGVGKMQKRIMVVDIDGQDATVIKPMCYVTLSIDHRALDAYQTNKFLSRFVEVIENWSSP